MVRKKMEGDEAQRRRAAHEAHRSGGSPIARLGVAAWETAGLLHDLVTVHGLATELAGSDTPDMGPRFEIKPRL
jgi:hypothetical protein